MLDDTDTYFSAYIVLTHNLIISRSRTLNPEHPQIVIGDTIVSESISIKLLGVTLDSKLTFETHLRSVASAVSSKVGLLRKCRKIYATDDIVRKCFYSFILPFFEYCSPVWLSAADSHLKLLNRAFNQVRFWLPNLNLKLDHRRLVGSLALLHKIYYNADHLLHDKLPPRFRPGRVTRYALQANDQAFSGVFCNSSQYERCFIPAITKVWNTLPSDIVNIECSQSFRTRVNTFLLH